MKLLLFMLRQYRKLVPAVTLVVLVAIAAMTDLFSHDVQLAVRAAVSEYARASVPFLMRLLTALILLNLVWLAHGPLCGGIESLLDKNFPEDTEFGKRGKFLALRLLRLSYWGVAVLVVLSLTAPEFMGKFVIAASVIGAALTLALQGAANDFICGLMIQFNRKIKVGDDMGVEGLQVQGKVVHVGYFSVVVETADSTIHVSNREVWARAVRVMKVKAKESPILLPPDFRAPKKK